MWRGITRFAASSGRCRSCLGIVSSRDRFSILFSAWGSRRPRAFSWRAISWRFIISYEIFVNFPVLKCFTSIIYLSYSCFYTRHIALPRVLRNCGIVVYNWWLLLRRWSTIGFPAFSCLRNYSGWFTGDLLITLQSYPENIFA